MPGFAVSFPSQSDFFGLTSSYKPSLFQEIYILVHHAGFTRDDVMKMPVFERRAYMSFLQKEIDEKNKAQKAANAKAKRR